MRKKLLLSCLSVIVLAALGIGANADMFKPYERYEIPVETADIIVEEMQEDEGIIEETIETNGTEKEETIVVTVADKKITFSSEGEKEEKQVVDTSPVNEGKTQSNNKPPKKASNDQSSAAEPVTPKPVEPEPIVNPGYNNNSGIYNINSTNSRRNNLDNNSNSKSTSKETGNSIPVGLLLFNITSISVIAIFGLKKLRTKNNKGIK